MEVLIQIKKYVRVVHTGIIHNNFLHGFKFIILFNKFILCRYSKEEPFSVISVDIRNHSNLTDSLEQYVKGELLEGADAYHCDKCNKKVGSNFKL